MIQEWLEINGDRLNKPFEVNIKGSVVRVLPSPFDIPDALKGRCSDRYAGVEFRYIGGEEPLKREEVDHGVFFSMGKNSGRLYKLEIEKDLAKEYSEEELRFFARETISKYKKKHPDNKTRSFEAIEIILIDLLPADEGKGFTLFR